MVRDLRLYKYESGNLHKIGRLKTDNPKRARHYFDNVEDIISHVDWLISKNVCQTTQFVIIEFFDNYKSKIILLV